MIQKFARSAQRLHARNYAAERSVMLALEFIEIDAPVRRTLPQYFPDRRLAAHSDAAMDLP
jgi:predicted kinase